MKKTFDDELSAVIVHNDKQLQNIKKDTAKMNSDIEKAAVVWQMDYGSKSGRCAKQFVLDYLSKDFKEKNNETE